jgi:hypothetical protein
MHSYLVGFNDDGILVKETVQATDGNNARLVAQPLHPDLQIIAIKELN